MKKKLLLTLLVVMTLVCLFTIAVSAVETTNEKGIISSDSNEFGTVNMLTDATITLDGVEYPLHSSTSTVREVRLVDGVYTYYKWGYVADGEATQADYYKFISTYHAGLSLEQRVVLDNGDGTFSTYPTAYIMDATNNNYKLVHMTPEKLNLYTGYNYTMNSIIRIEFPEGVSRVGHDERYAININTADNCVYLSLPSTMNVNNYTPMGSAFYQMEALVTLDLSKCTTLTSFGGSWFGKCQSLKNVYLPSSLTSIPSNAFQNCTALETIELPNSLTIISSYAFNGCSALKSIEIPAGITLIGNRSFQNCSALASLKFRGNAGENATIEIAAFEGCLVIGDVAIPEGFTTFGEAVFQAAGVTNLSLPTTLTTLDSNGKQFCVWGSKVTNDYKLKSVTGLENTQITSIPNSMFRGQAQWNADVVRLPNTVQSTGSYSFADCAFYNIYLGAGLTSLGNETFTACANLKNVYMPGTITTFGSNPFYGKGVYFLVTSSDTTYLDTINSKAGSSNDYVSYADYKANPDNYKSGKYIIYGLNLCETFYNGHDTEGVVGVNQFKGDKYVTDYICVSGCNRNCGMQAETILCGPLFTNKGYSKIADGTMFTYGIVIDEENIAKYVELTGKAFNYGVIIGAANFDSEGNLIETNAIIDNTGKALIESSIVVDFSKVELKNFTIYNVKMCEINTSAQQQMPIYCCAYIIDGDAVFYMGNEVTENAKTISSSAITVIETTTTTPPVAGEDNA